MSVKGNLGVRAFAAMAVPAVQEAWVYHEYGPAKEVLKLEEVPVPDVKPDQVLIKVKAAGINPVDFKRRTGYVTLNSPFPVHPSLQFHVILISFRIQVELGTNSANLCLFEICLSHCGAWDAI